MAGRYPLRQFWQRSKNPLPRSRSADAKWIYISGKSIVLSSTTTWINTSRDARAVLTMLRVEWLNFHHFLTFRFHFSRTRIYKIIPSAVYWKGWEFSCLHGPRRAFWCLCKLQQQEWNKYPLAFFWTMSMFSLGIISYGDSNLFYTDGISGIDRPCVYFHCGINGRNLLTTFW